MPQIPFFENQRSAQIGAPGPTTSPAEWGAAAGTAAQGFEQVSREAAAWGEVYTHARRQANAADLTADAMAKLGDAQFRWSKVPDNLAAQAGFNQEAQQIRDQTLARSNDPLVSAYVKDRLDEHILARSQLTRQEAFGLESSKRRGELDTRLFQYAQSAATADNPLLQAQIKDQAAADIKGSVAAGWLRPEEGDDRALRFGSTMQKVQVEKSMFADPGGTLDRLQDPANYQGLLPQDRESLMFRADRRYNTMLSREIRDEARADRNAEKLLRKTQATNEVKLLTDIYNWQAGKGPQPDMTAVADTAAHQGISVAGLEAAHAALDRATEGKDQPLIVNDLWRRLAAGDDIHDDVRQGIIDHTISNSTQQNLMRANAARSDKGDTAVVREDFGQLKTALGGHAVENGFFKDPEANARASAKWAEAQGEFWTRVRGGEDSGQVKDDMIGRYQKLTPAPAAWPDPKLGRVTSSADVQAVGAATFKEHEAGAMDDATYDREVANLNRYRAYYAQQDREAAIAAQKKKTPGSGGARVRGLVPPGEQ